MKRKSAPATTGKEAKLMQMALSIAIYVSLVATALYATGLGQRLTGF